MAIRPKGPTMELREVCWRVIEGPSGRLVVCAIYENTNADFELRVGYASDHTVRSEYLPDRAGARVRAEQWLGDFRAAGSLGPLSNR